MIADVTRRLVLTGLLGPAVAFAQTGASTPESAPTPVPAPSATAAPFSSARPIEVLDDALELIEREYVDAGVTREELVEAAMRGIVEHLNRRALKTGQPATNALLSRREMTRLTDSLSGETNGIGVEAQPVSGGGIEVIRVFASSPASKAGIKPGDRITAIDGFPISGLEAFAMLRGTDSAPVRLKVLRPAVEGADPTPLDVKLVRSRYRFSTVQAGVLDGDVGYVRVGGLSRGAADDVAGALLEFVNQASVWSVVVDLRGNSGGSLHEATRIAEAFTKPGAPLFQIQTRAEATQLVTSSGEQLWQGPVAVLVNGNTASACEALAAALQSNGAMLVGERTAGRGLGESIFPLPSGGALRLATARYRTAEGASWIGRGLSPESEVAPISLDPQAPLDPQLDNALRLLGQSRATSLRNDGLLAPVELPLR